MLPLIRSATLENYADGDARSRCANCNRCAIACDGSSPTRCRLANPAPS